MTRLPILALPACLVLSACNVADLGATATAAGYANRIQQVTSALATSPTPLTSIPVPGDATMTGVLTVAAPTVNLTQTALGAMTMTTNFATNSVTGSVNNFVATEVNPTTGATTTSAASGSLNFSGIVTIGDGAFAIDGPVVGSVDIGDAGGAITNGRIRGGFYSTSLGLASSGGVTGEAGGSQIIGNYLVAE